MKPSSDVPVQADPADIEPFRFEGSEAFRLALEAADLCDRLAVKHRARRPWFADQIGRCGLSILNNTAEGNGEHSPGDKARFYRYALRSGAESAAMILFLERMKLMSPDEAQSARRLFLKLMATLGRTAIYFDRKAPHQRTPARRT